MNLGGLAAGLSAIYPGEMQGRNDIADLELKNFKVKDMLTQMGAMAARGRGLEALFGGGGQPPMGGQPGQSSAPPQGPPQVPFMSQAQGQQMPPRMQMPGAPQMGAGGFPGGGAPGMPPGGNPGMGGPPPGAGGGMPAGGGGMAGGGQGLDWRMIIQSLQRANPGLKPEELAAAVDQYMPMMTMNARQEWQMLSMQLRHEMQQDQLSTRREIEGLRSEDRARAEGGKDRRSSEANEGRNYRADLAADLRRETEAGRNERAQLSADTRYAIGLLSSNTRKEIADRLEGGRNARAELSNEARQEIQRMKGDQGRELQEFLEQGRERRADQTADVAREGQSSRERIADRAEKGRNERATSAGGRTSATQLRHEESQRNYKQVRTTISDALDDLKKGYTGTVGGVTGLPGGAQRISEILQNISGWSNRTLANQFAQKIELLRAQLPKMLAGRSNIAKDERDRITRIVPGLEKGSTQQITFDDLMYLDKVLGMRMAPEKDTGRSESRSTEGGLQRMTPDIKAKMDKARAEGHSSAEIEKYVRGLGYDPASSPE